ncbi:MAG: HDIG domain-containing metalloprotein [Pseudomonadota bacterium]
MPDKPKISAYRGKQLKWFERDPSVKGRPSSRSGSPNRGDGLKWAVLIALCLFISVFLFPNILIKPEIYRLGDVAGSDIKAADDFLIENKEITEKSREDAIKKVFSVYDLDRSSSNIASRLQDAFKTGREYVKESTPSEVRPESPPQSEGNSPKDDSERMTRLINRFFGILELPQDDRLLEQLLRLGFSVKIQEGVIRLIKAVYERGVVGSRPMLNSQMEKGGIILHEINSKKEIREKDLNQFYDLEEARALIKNQTGPLGVSMGDKESADLAITLARLLLTPNLTFNQRETESGKDLARASIKPIYYKIKRGEMLVREGERIGPEHLLKLSEQDRAKKGVDVSGRVPAMAILIGFLLFVVYGVGLKETQPVRKENRHLIFNAFTLFGMFVFAWAYNFVAEEIARGFHTFAAKDLLFALPIGCAAMLISIFQGIGISVVFSLVMAVLASLVTGGQVEFFIYFFVHSLVAAYGVRNCTERGILIKAGLLVGLVNVILSLSMEVIFGSLNGTGILIASTSAFFGGVLTGVIATGILPLVEMSFGFTTDIKLLELANLDQPLLRDLMVRSPGTYHHSVITSSMVEATAKAVNANPLLAKVSAYYHDIGKMKKPLYFIENQMGGENRHEKLAPSMSSLILISHVKDGVELARGHKLGREIIDIIEQHHGTSLISYFYQKAKDRMIAKGVKGTEVKEEDFRYPGPKPQTKEAGLVMLADMVEAASRSLSDPTPARIQGTVQKIINKVFSDGQLDECELTLKDLHEIAKSFNQILSGIFHHRIEYPDAPGKNGKKGKNGHTDQVPAEASGSKKPEDQAEFEEGLRRLGL